MDVVSYMALGSPTSLLPCLGTAPPSHRRQREGNRAKARNLAAHPFFDVGHDRAWVSIDQGRAELMVERGIAVKRAGASVGGGRGGGVAARFFSLVGGDRAGPGVSPPSGGAAAHRFSSSVGEGRREGREVVQADGPCPSPSCRRPLPLPIPPLESIFCPRVIASIRGHGGLLEFPI
jgi:hypothetical protein